YWARSQWMAKSWDQTILPKPFTTIGVSYGEPIYVASEADENELEGKRREVEDALNMAVERAKELCGDIASNPSTAE
ncbi:hypothetical protein ACFL1X_14315, partial [Candidatus Hydrogenedentota bacterium]